MKIIKKIEKEKDSSYHINEDGEIIQMQTKIKKIDKIDKKEDYIYSIDNLGNIIEKQIIYLSFNKFYEYKKNGKLAQLFREGYEVKVKEDEIPISKFENFENDFLISQIKNTKIIDVLIKRQCQTKEITFLLDNGKKIILKEGLLSNSLVFELR